MTLTNDALSPDANISKSLKLILHELDVSTTRCTGKETLSDEQRIRSEKKALSSASLRVKLSTTTSEVLETYKKQWV